MYAMRPGGISSPRNLDEMLRRLHELEREVILEQRAIREEAGVPLTDEQPWHERAYGVAAALERAVMDGDLEAARACLPSLQGLLAEPLEDPGEYVSDAGAAKLWFRFRSLSHAEHTDRLNAIVAAAKEHGPTSDEVDALVAEYVKRVVVWAEGFEDDEGCYDIDEIDDAAIGLFRSVGILYKLYLCARDMQRLEPHEKKVFGLPPSTTPSTSASAIAAPPVDVPSGDATAAPSPSTGPAPSTRTTPVRGGTSSSSPGSSTPTPSTPAREVSSASRR